MTDPNLRSLAERNEIRILCFDLDGTVVNTGNTISSATIESVQAARKLGKKVILATGRPLFVAREFAQQLGAEGASVFNSGALIYDFSLDKALRSHPLPAEVLRELIDLARSEDFELELYLSDKFYVDRIGPLHTAHVEHYIKFYAEERDLDEVAASETVLKATVMVERESSQDRALKTFARSGSQISAGEAPGIHDTRYVFHNIAAASATREAAFEDVLDYFGVNASQVMCFGDAPQDTVFFRLAGIGVAMGNADSETQAAADYVTASIDEEGVARAIEKAFL